MDPETFHDELGLTHPADGERFERIMEARKAARARLAGGTTLKVVLPEAENPQEPVEEEPDLRTPEERRAHAASKLRLIRDKLNRDQDLPG